MNLVIFNGSFPTCIVIQICSYKVEYNLNKKSEYDPQISVPTASAVISTAATVGVMSKEANKQKRKAAAATAAVPLIDNRLIPKPLQVKPGEPCSITVNISGLPPPVVRWQIGRRRVKESSKYQLTTDGLLGHTLVIARATEDLEQGVWVVASNEHGEDCCQIEVDAHSKTIAIVYSKFLKRRLKFKHWEPAYSQALMMP